MIELAKVVKDPVDGPGQISGLVQTRLQAGLIVYKKDNQRDSEIRSNGKPIVLFFNITSYVV